KQQLESLHNQPPVDDLFDLATDAKSIEFVDAESVDEPWLTIDLDHAKRTPRKAEPEFISAETTADLISVEIDPIPVVALHHTHDFAMSAGPAIPSDIAERLQSSESSDRVAALVDLADAGSEDSFGLITKAFDDPSV